MIRSSLFCSSSAYDFALSLALQKKRTTHLVSQQRHQERGIIGLARLSFVTEILFSHVSFTHIFATQLFWRCTQLSPSWQNYAPITYSVIDVSTEFLGLL
jgi:hypothetical protein